MKKGKRKRVATDIGPLTRIGLELSQGWAIMVQDVKTYYLSTPIIMWGLLMPFFLFLPLLMQEGMTLQKGVVSLLATITFLTASSIGPVILPLERRTRTYDRLLVAPISLVTILLAKSLVGVLFCLGVSVVSLVIGLVFFNINITSLTLLLVSIILSALAFSALGILFASGTAQSPGKVLMPTMLLRWPLLFISGVFVPLEKMAPWVRALGYVSPLTYAQDLISHAVLGVGAVGSAVVVKPCGRILEGYETLMAGARSPQLDMAILLCLTVLFYLPALKLHERSRRLGY